MNFSKEPFIVDKKLSLALVDGRVSEEIEKNLVKRGIRLIKSIECRDTYSEVAYHPDISIFNCGDGKVVVCPNLYDDYKKIFKEYGIEAIKGETFISDKYPGNIAYNVCVVGNNIIHKYEHTDPVIKEYIEKRKMNIINVKQGYSKCSVCVVDNNSIITSDAGIHREVIKHGIDSLLIKPGEIELFGMNYGFIGGCSGMISENEIGFTGNIERHSDYEIINEFLTKRDKKAVSLGKEKLVDLGSIIPLATE